MPRLQALIGPATAAVALAASACKARTRSVGPREERVFRAFNNAPDSFHAPAWVVMQSGSLAAVFVASAGLVRSGRRQEAAASLIAGVSMWAGAKALKPIIGRGRPAAHLEAVHVRGQAQSGLGYPSGHAAVAMTLALIASRDRPPAARLASVMAAGVTGDSRMYVGAHLPLDVMGGLAAGLLCGRAANAFLDRCG